MWLNYMWKARASISTRRSAKATDDIPARRWQVPNITASWDFTLYWAETPSYDDIFWRPCHTHVAVRILRSEFSPPRSFLAFHGVKLSDLRTSKAKRIRKKHKMRLSSYFKARPRVKHSQETRNSEMVENAQENELKLMDSPSPFSLFQRGGNANISPRKLQTRSFFSLDTFHLVGFFPALGSWPRKEVFAFPSSLGNTRFALWAKLFVCCFAFRFIMQISRLS